MAERFCNSSSPLHRFRQPTERYLYGLNHPVGEFQRSHGCRGAKGGSAPLKPSDNAAILPVLLYWQPDQVLQALH